MVCSVQVIVVITAVHIPEDVVDDDDDDDD